MRSFKRGQCRARPHLDGRPAREHRESDVINESSGSGLPGAIRTTKYVRTAFNTMTNDTDAAVPASGSKRVDGALEGVESVRLAVDSDGDRARILISAGLAA